MTTTERGGIPYRLAHTPRSVGGAERIEARLRKKGLEMGTDFQIDLPKGDIYFKVWIRIGL